MVTEEEVEPVINSLPLKKAAGLDHLTNEHLKFGGTNLPIALTPIFNTILISGHIPAAFKHGFIISILKSHTIDLSDSSNYRGITLLSVISKVFEKVLLLHLADQQAKLNLLKGGFRSGLSCLQSAIVFQEAVYSLQEQKNRLSWPSWT